MEYSASNIAAAIVQKAIDEGKPITQMQVQKMVFFAHGYNLAKRDLPLIKEEFQAWKFGPVVPIIYNDYKLYGKYPISSFDMVWSYNVKHLENLGEDALDAISYTWKATNHLSATELSAWTHKNGSPWHEVYNPHDLSIPIKNSRIKLYFEGFIYGQAT